MLETIDVETAPKPNAAIIWLHGLGADGHDFEPVVPQLVPRLEKAWRFVFPHAPVRPVTVNNGMRMRAWYDIKGFDRKAAEDIAGFKDADTQVRALIARENARGIPTHRIVVAGFSQGGAVCLYTFPRLGERLAGVMALSCYLPRESSFAAERLAANDATPISWRMARGCHVAHGVRHGIARLFARPRLYRGVARISDGPRGLPRRNHGHPRISVSSVAVNLFLKSDSHDPEKNQKLTATDPR